MSLKRLVAGLLIAVWVTFAQAAEPVLETLPHDAIAGVQINRPQRLLPREQLQALCSVFASSEVRGKKLAEAITKLPGEIVVGFLEGKEKDQKVAISIAMDIKGLQGDIDELIKRDFLPAAAEMDSKHENVFALETSAKIRRVIAQASGKTVFAYATNKEILFGCTRPEFVQGWLSGEWPDKRLVQEAGVRRGLAQSSRKYAVRAIVNPKWVGLLNRRTQAEPNSFEDLLNKVYPAEEIESIIAEIEWEQAVLSMSLKVAFAEKCQGFVKILAQPATVSQNIGAFSAEYPVVGRIGWQSLQGMIDGLYALTDRFDPAISQEYREDIAAFKKETGCDWDGGILGNLTGEMAFGARVDFTKMPPVAWSLVCPLVDESEFNAAIEKLTGHFGIVFAEDRRGEILIRKSTKTFPFSMCVDHGRLILSDGPETVIDTLKSGGRDRIASEPLRGLYQVLGEKNQMAVLVDIEQLVKTTPLAMMAPEKLRNLLVGRMGICLSNQDRIAMLLFRWDMHPRGRNKPREVDADTEEDTDSNEDSVVALLGSAVDSIREMRASSMRTLSQANMRGIGQALYISAQDTKGQFPPDMATLLKANNVTVNMFANPYTGETVADEAIDKDSYLLYRPGLSTSSDPREVLLAEKPQEGAEGANFMFVDSHVEFVPEPEASELIEKMKKGEAEIRLKEGSGR